MELFRELDEQETEEFKQWARDNYCPDEERSMLWHPVVRAEMDRLDMFLDTMTEEKLIEAWGGRHCPKCDTGYLMFAKKTSEIAMVAFDNVHLDITGEGEEEIVVDRLWCSDCDDIVWIRPRILIVEE